MKNVKMKYSRHCSLFQSMCLIHTRKSGQGMNQPFSLPKKTTASLKAVEVQKDERR